MHRRRFLTAAGVTALAGVTSLAGCLDRVGLGGSRFRGPTEEDRKAVDVRYRTFTEDEVATITSEAEAVPYAELLDDLEAYEGSAVTFTGVVVEVLDRGDHQVYRLSVAGNPQALEYVYASWTGEPVAEAAVVRCWGVVLGREVYAANMGREEVVPAVAIADLEPVEES